MTEEKTFFQDRNITVTNSQITVGSETFDMKSIKSVRVTFSGPNRILPIAIILLGVIHLLLPISGSKHSSVFMIVFCIGWLARQKKTYYVTVLTAETDSGARVYTSKDLEYIEKIEQAVKDAIGRLHPELAISHSPSKNFHETLGLCPNCDAKIELNLTECPHCKANFGPNSEWKVKPLIVQTENANEAMEDVNEVEAEVRQLRLKGYTVEKTDLVWDVKEPWGYRLTLPNDTEFLQYARRQ